MNSFLAFALAVIYPAMVAGEYDIKCETNSGSPWTEDVTGAINQIKDRPQYPGMINKCKNSNGVGSHCTTVSKHYSAGIGVCDSYNDISCHEVGEAVMALQQKCKAEVDGHVRVAGIVKVDGVRITVFQESINGKLLIT